MGTKIVTTTEIISVCPNQEEHLKDLVAKMKAQPSALLSRPFPRRDKPLIFCDQCGVELIDKTIKHENEVCERCGEAIYPSDSYCTHCGDKIR